MCLTMGLTCTLLSLVTHVMLFNNNPNMNAIYAAGVILSVGYTAPPLKLKYRGLGDLTVGAVFNPLLAGYHVSSSGGTWYDFVSSTKAILPITLVTIGILHGNNLRDIKDDLKAGVRTFAGLLGRRVGGGYYKALILGSYCGYFLLAWMEGGVYVGMAVGCMVSVQIAKGNFGIVDRGELEVRGMAREGRGKGVCYLIWYNICGLTHLLHSPPRSPRASLPPPPPPPLRSSCE